MIALAARFSFFFGIAIFVAAVSLPALHARAEDAPTPAAAPAMRVYRDPITGEFTQPPAPEPGRAVAPQPPAPPPLVVEPNPNGGGKARLGEPYAHTLTATKDASGKTTVGCERGVPAAKE